MMLEWRDLAVVAGWLGLTVATGRAFVRWVVPWLIRWTVERLTKPYERRLADAEETLDDHLKNRYRHGGTEDERKR